MRSEKAVMAISSIGGTPFCVGVGTHSQTHTIAVLDAVGRTLMTGTYPATSAGYHDVIQELAGLGRSEQFQVGVERTGSYGQEYPRPCMPLVMKLLKYFALPGRSGGWMVNLTRSTL